jgi:phosphoglycolate phosphatase
VVENAGMIKAVLFDKDGTLLDVNGTWVPFYRAMLKQEQGLGDADIDQKMQSAGLDLATGKFRAGSLLAGGTTRQIVGQWWPTASTTEQAAITRRLDIDLAPMALGYMTPLMPLAPVFEALRDMALQLGVATNDSETSARLHMKALHVDGQLEAIIGADSVVAPKPSGDMIRLFAAKTGLAPADIAMVGDNIHDIEEARNGGAGLAIGVLSGNSSTADFAGLADHVVSNIADLPRLLEGL